MVPQATKKPPKRYWVVISKRSGMRSIKAGQEKQVRSQSCHSTLCDLQPSLSRHLYGCLRPEGAQRQLHPLPCMHDADCVMQPGCMLHSVLIVM